MAAAASLASSVTPGGVDLFVPGRVCLFGEHSDWAASYTGTVPGAMTGHALVCGTTHGLFARAHKTSDNRFTISAVVDSGSANASPKVERFECEMDVTKLRAVAVEGGFWSYACGVAVEVLTHFAVGGLRIENYKTDLPVKKGLSSSAALCVLVARAFNRLYDLKWTVRGEMDIAYRGEINTPSRCGRLDQCCAFGTSVVSMDFFGSSRVEAAPVPLAGPDPLYLVIVDLCGRKDTKRILDALHDCYRPAAINSGVVDLFGARNEAVVSLAIHAFAGTGPFPRPTPDAKAADTKSPPPPQAATASASPAAAASKHFNEIVGLVTAGSAAGARFSIGQLIGRLMAIAQHNFDSFAAPACPDQLTSPLLHKLLKFEAIAKYVYGGKGVGSQGDGTAQLVVTDAAAQATVIQLIQSGLGMTGLPITLHPTAAAAASPASNADFVLPASTATK